MKNIFIYTAGLLLLLTSCNSIDSKIITEYKRQTSKQNFCIVNISSLVDFEWDKMYAIKHVGSIDNSVPEVIRKKVSNSTEVTRKLIFTLNDSIVYYEDHSVDIERLKKNEVIFDIPDTAFYKIYPKEKAIFRVIKKENPTTWYYLQQIE